MKCPGCGAAMSSAMLKAGDCPYCGTALPKAAAKPAQPQVVHVTNVEIRAPDIEVAGVVNGVTGRVFGCFSGCLSAGITLAITAMVLGFTAWQIWMQTKHLPSPPSSPPAAEHPKPSRRR